MRKTVRVYDDTPGRGEKYAAIIRDLKVVRENFVIESIGEEDFREELRILRERQSKTRLGQQWDDESLFDRTTVLVIDYDLLKTSKNTSLTGENVAYLTRCFSKCNFILGLNIDIKIAGTNPFDLTLRGHPESFCDLNIGSGQLSNEGLWGDKRNQFRPWYWPQLPNYLSSFKERITEVVEHLDDAISEVLEIEGIMRNSPRSVTDFLVGDPLKTTFRKFVEKSGNGLRGRDKSPPDELVGRIAAARLSKWLERLVLTRQDSIIDAPHLVSRYPSLLEGDKSDVSVWNKTTKFEKYDKLGLNHEIIEEFRYGKTHWFSRPVWFWGDLSESSEIKEVREPWEREMVKFVFCEDSSSFYEREQCKKFSIKSDSPYNRRFIRYIKEENVNYQPRVRLL